MKFIKKSTIPIILGSFLSFNCNAGFYGLTHHSRSNCAGFNESVTWWAFHSFLARVNSYHYPHGKSKPNDTANHVIKLSKTYEFRHAAYHVNEAYEDDDYSVVGEHYMYVNGKEQMAAITFAKDCSIYDGWWD